MEVEPPAPAPQAPKLDAMDTANDAPAATPHHHAAAESEGDLYTRLKTLQRQLEFYEIQVRRERWKEEEKEKERERKRERIEKEKEGIDGSIRAPSLNLDLSTSTSTQKKKTQNSKTPTLLSTHRRSTSARSSAPSNASSSAPKKK